ncbi:MAG: hypothetical protein KTR17_11965 [Cellvibrionaceae bacterium]|nr:hypothetical protein [Cellvibrionaceae bacterium]
MYDPASFLDYAPTMFYALEEDFLYKVRVVFVHGIGGSIRQFNDIVQGMARDRYKPWYLYYSSGGDLHQLARLFYEIFLAGKVIRLHIPAPKDSCAKKTAVVIFAVFTSV